MLPNLPPGVASSIRYRSGQEIGAGFPALSLAAGLQQPTRGYGGVGAGPQLGGVSGQPLGTWRRCSVARGHPAPAGVAAPLNRPSKGPPQRGLHFTTPAPSLLAACLPSTHPRGGGTPATLSLTQTVWRRELGHRLLQLPRSQHGGLRNNQLPQRI